MVDILNIDMTQNLEPGPWLAIHKSLNVGVPDFDDRPVGAFVELYAQSMPDHCAIQFMDRSISYGELNELANRFANALLARGVGENDVVGLHMTNIPQYMVAVVAVAKLGAVGSGSSPLLTPKEVINQIEDAGAKALISLDVLAQPLFDSLGRLPSCVQVLIATNKEDLRAGSGNSSLLLGSTEGDDFLALLRESSADFEQRQTAPNDVCFIQYTGGTTGRPKGAMLTLRGIMYNTLIAHPYRPWKVGLETAVNAFPPNHIAGLALIVWALRYGATTVQIPDPRDIDHFCQQLLNYPPTRLAGVPTLYNMIANHPLSTKIDFSHLRNAQTGAAPITGDDRRRIERMLGGIVLSDSFGMTEAGPTALVNPPERCKPESVGIPVPSVDVRIVDVETGEHELPYGEPGEIIISSPCLMKGYVNRPEESKNSLRQWHGKTWMHTGDIGVMDSEGYVYLKDRAKDMIIVNGYKVFSVEVEEKLSMLDFVSCCAVVGSADAARPGSEIVNAFVELAKTDEGIDRSMVEETIQSFCRSEMASYKVPKVVKVVDAIPLTAVGKIDKKALRVMAQQRNV